MGPTPRMAVTTAVWERSLARSELVSSLTVDEPLHEAGCGVPGLVERLMVVCEHAATARLTDTGDPLGCSAIDDGDLDADEEALRGGDHEDNVPVGVNDRGVAPAVGYLKEEAGQEEREQGRQSAARNAEKRAEEEWIVGDGVVDIAYEAEEQDLLLLIRREFFSESLGFLKSESARMPLAVAVVVVLLACH